MSTITIEQANFADCKINGKYLVKMPEFLADRERSVLDYWEFKRFQSMEEHLKPGMVLFDVGAETGYMSAIYASFVGPENLFMVESNPDNWQNIYATWKVMGLADPLGTFCGLASDRNTIEANFDDSYEGVWPTVALTGNIWTVRSFRYLHEHKGHTPQRTVDALQARLNPYRKIDALTIDVEGAELEVLRGAWSTICVYRPLTWVSIHPDLMERDYGHSQNDLMEFMRDCGYENEFLAQDHEAHYFFFPR